MLRAVSLFGFALILFVAGMMVTILDVFPAPYLKDAYNGGMALYAKWTQYNDIHQTDLWQPARTPERGVLVNDESRTEPGFTLYESGHEPAAFLISADGEVLHQWRRPFSTVQWQDSPIRDPLPDQNVYFRRVHPFPNGDLLVVYEGAGDTPYGYGMVKLDRNSEVLWSYSGRTHHDFDVAPDGRIYALTHENRKKRLTGMEHLADTRTDDFVDILSPDGKLQKRVSLIEAVAGSPFAHLLHTTPGHSLADALHTNTIKVLTPEAARILPGTEPGQVMLSFRDSGVLAVLDVERETIVWALRGPWMGQHDPDILSNGNILLFDNLGRFDHPGGKSRVIEINPRTAGIVWEFSGSEDRPFTSEIRADQQRLPNGNTLINESSGGRILEITPTGDVVWEYVNPVRGGPDDSKIPIVSGAQRLPPDFFEAADWNRSLGEGATQTEDDNG